MGCGTTKEKPNELEPEQIMVISKKKEDKKQNINQDNNTPQYNKEDVLLIKSKKKPKTKKDKFIQDALEKHNELRAAHGVEPLTISEDLNIIAQKYAEHLASIDKIVRSDNTYKGEELGENIYCCLGKEIEGDLMTTTWYEEINEYNFDNPGFSSETGHFTQIVWKDTKKVGFGFAQSSSGIYYGVGYYFPVGNINTKNDFMNNVLRKKII